MAIYDNITDVFNAMWPLFADRLQNTLIQAGSGAITSPPATAGAPAGAQYLTLANDAALTSERVFALDANSGLVGVDAGANNSYYLSLGAPTTLTVSTTNSVFGTSHTHAIISSSNPGASASLLSSDASGFLTLPQFTATNKVRTPLIDTASGTLTLTPATAVAITDGKTLNGSTTFVSGFAGAGWRIDQGVSYASQSAAEFDNLTVRGLMRVYELLIQKIRTGNGSYLFAPGGKVASVSGTGPYTLTFESDHGLAANDLIRAQKFDLAFGDVYQSNMTVTSVSSITVLIASLSSGVAPQAGYEYARVGNTSDTNRQGGVYITSDDTGAPYLDVFDGINSFAAWGSTTPKARLGRLAGITDALWGALSGYGLYTQSGYFTGGIRAMSGRIDGVLDIGTAGGIYQGSGTFASPSTGLKIWNSSGVGAIAGYNAGTWQWQGSTDGKFYIGQYIRGDQDGLYLYGNYQPGYGTSGSLQVRTAGSIYFGYDNYRSPRMFGTVTSNGTPTSGGTDYNAKLEVTLPASGAGGSAKVWSIDSSSGLMSWDGSISAASNITTSGAMYASNWFRTYGDCGWYSETYGGGIYMVDTTWVRTYNSKSFLSSSVIRADGGFQRNGVWGGIYVPLGAYYTCATTGGTTLNGGGSIGTGNYTINITSYGVPSGARAVQLAVSWSYDTTNSNYYTVFTYGGQNYSVHRANGTNVVWDATVIIPISSDQITFSIVGRYINQIWVGAIGYFY